MTLRVACPLAITLVLPASASADPPQFLPSVIDSAVTRAISVQPLDVDADGDLDVVVGATLTNTTSWSENLGGGVFGPPIVLSTTAASSATRQGDLDGDGDLDLVVVSLYNGLTNWFENVGGGAFVEIGVEVGSHAKGLDVGDVDGDGDLDLVRGGMSGGSLAWLENLGGASFAPAVVVDAVRVTAAGARLVDVDGDGDPDIVASFPTSGEVVWYENLGGGAFGGAQVVDTNSSPDIFAVVDVDSDGRLDVVYTDFVSGDIVAVHNDPAGFMPVTLASGLPNPMPVTAEDFDQDGDPDLVVASTTTNLTWFLENLGGGVYGPAEVVEPRGAWSVASGDLDDDGVPDFVVGNRDDIVVAYHTVVSTRWTGGDYGGADITVGDLDVLDGVFTNVGVFTVPEDVTAWVAPGVPLEIHADEIVIEGTLSADEAGEPMSDGAGIPDGTGLGGGHAGDLQGGGGGSMGGRGGRGGDSGCLAGPTQVGGRGGRRYGLPWDAVATMGSSGGAGGFGSSLTTAGGAGGGAVSLFADTIEVGPTGRLFARGGHAREADGPDTGGGGGGSGGTLVLDGQASVLVHGTVRAIGGNGGDGANGYCNDPGGGGGGGGGRIKVFGPYSGPLTLDDVAGGAGGAGAAGNDGAAGSPGALYIESLLVGPPSLLITGGATTDVLVSGATPHASLALLTGTGVGVEPVPNGPCAGVGTGLAGARVQGRFHADDLGELSLTTATPPLATGEPVQVVDELSCTLSTVELMP